MFNIANMFRIQDVRVRNEKDGKVGSEGFNFHIVSSGLDDILLPDWCSCVLVP
jgi:hypothetical protein